MAQNKNLDTILVKFKCGDRNLSLADASYTQEYQKIKFMKDIGWYENFDQCGLTTAYFENTMMQLFEILKNHCKQFTCFKCKTNFVIEVSIDIDFLGDLIYDKSSYVADAIIAIKNHTNMQWFEIADALRAYKLREDKPRVFSDENINKLFSYIKIMYKSPVSDDIHLFISKDEK